MEKVQFVSTDSVFPNQTKLRIYQSEPENYNSIKDSISKHGIIEPLLANAETKVLISGNLRLKIAKELGLNMIPVIFMNVDEKEMDKKSIASNEQRLKTSLELLKEIKFYEKMYPIGQGKRTDKDPELKQVKEERDNLFSSVPRDRRFKLKKIDQLATELYGEGTPEYHHVFNSIDNGKTTIHGQVQTLIDKKNRMGNELVVPESYDIIGENPKIYNKSSEDMSDVPDNSIHAIITSPPYFQMKIYGNDDELGQEDDVDKYLRKLMLIFKECHRVLREDGSLFVNINDCVIDGHYQAVPQRFLGYMIKAGWIFNDELIWIKNNAQYTRGTRSVRSHEYIYHFVKSNNFYYNDSWLLALKDIDNQIVYGTHGVNPKVLSGLDFRDNVLRTNASNTSELRKKCMERGFYLTHSATFPIHVPTICGLLTTKEGDTILDCFNGTAVAGEYAIRNNRKYIGYELNPQYVMASEVRLEGLVTEWSKESPEMERKQMEEILREMELRNKAAQGGYGKKIMGKIGEVFTKKLISKPQDSTPKFDKFSSMFDSVISILDKYN